MAAAVIPYLQWAAPHVAAGLVSGSASFGVQQLLKPDDDESFYTADQTLPSFYTANQTLPTVGSYQTANSAALDAATASFFSANQSLVSNLMSLGGPASLPVSSAVAPCPVDCYDQCRQNDLNTDTACKELNRKYEEQMEAIGCSGTKCSYKSKAKTCAKRRRKSVKVCPAVMERINYLNAGGQFNAGVSPTVLSPAVMERINYLNAGGRFNAGVM
jgi:hypothetical protein